MEHSGGCLCGAVRFEATLKSSEIGACHCGMCRKWTGGPYMSAAAAQVQWGDTTALRTFSSSQWAERGFCSTCGSSLFYRITAPGPAQGLTMLAVGALDDPNGLALTHEVFTDKRPDAYSFAGELSGMTEAEVFAKYAPS